MNAGAALDLNRYMRKPRQTFESLLVVSGSVRTVGHQGNDSCKMTRADAPRWRSEIRSPFCSSRSAILCDNAGSGEASRSTAPAERTRDHDQLRMTTVAIRPIRGSIQAHPNSLPAISPTMTKTDTAASASTWTKAARKLWSRWNSASVSCSCE